MMAELQDIKQPFDVKLQMVNYGVMAEMIGDYMQDIKHRIKELDPDGTNDEFTRQLDRINAAQHDIYQASIKLAGHVKGKKY